MNPSQLESVFLTTPVQQAMILWDQTSREIPQDCAQVLCEVSDMFDRKSFQGAWRRLLELHPMLRVSFVWKRVRLPLQIVHRHTEARIEYHDWKRLPHEQQQLRIEQLVLEQRRQRFELSLPPLVRACIVERAPQSFWILITAHRAVVDAASLSFVLSEAVRMAREKLSDVDLLGHAMSPADWIDWFLAQDAGTAAAYWKNQLGGVSKEAFVTNNFVQKQSDAISRAWPRQRAKRLSEVTSNRLRSLAVRTNTTIGTIIGLAWALLQSRYSGSSEVIVGASVSNRFRSECGPRTIGPFENTLPMLLRFDSLQSVERSLLEWCDQEKALVRNAGWPLEKVMLWSELGYIEVVLPSGYRADSSSNQPPCKQLPSLKFYDGRDCPVTLSVSENQSNIRLSISYREECLLAVQAERVLRHIEFLIEGISVHPEQSLKDLSPLAQSEKVELLVRWNLSPSHERRNSSSIPQVIEEWATKFPDAQAGTSGATDITYGALNARANQLARYLRGHGIGPEDRIGILLLRSVHMLVAILAVMKVGAAYVFCDPNSPAERIEEILKDACAAALITEESLIGQTGAVQIRKIMLDQEYNLIRSENCCNMPWVASANNLAYVAYTSGSNGKPKGVLVSCGSLVDYARAFADQAGLRPDDRVLQFAAVDFDVTAEEIFPTWVAGACVVLRDNKQWISCQELLNLLEVGRVTQVELPTAFWRIWTNFVLSTGATLPSSLRRVIIGGEKVDTKLAFEWTEKFKPKLAHVYGVTEATITSTYYDVSAHSRLLTYCETLPIGRPVPPSELYVLDSEMHPVPAGAVGELFIGGSGLARGYLHDARTTAEKFLPDPFASTPGNRLYRTGDKVRYRFPKILEFVGREDGQVKIRGCRIELTGIEAVLVQHPAIMQCLVVAERNDENEVQTLTAYYVLKPDKGKSITGVDVREWLKKKLPQPMIPSRFIGVGSLALTPHGKLDRSNILSESGAHEADVASPGSPLEETVARIFAEAFRVPRVGALDNFFDLGGHSLLAIQITTRIREVLGIPLQVRTIFEAPSVRLLSGRIVNLKPDLSQREPALAPESGASISEFVR